MGPATRQLFRATLSPHSAPSVRKAHGVIARRHFLAAETLIEVLAAATILAVTLTGIYVSTGRALATVKATRENVEASRILQDRAEQIRTTTWTNITTSAYLSGNLLSNVTTTGSNLIMSEAALGANVTEAMYVNPYPLPPNYQPPQITGSTIGCFRTISNGTPLVTSTGAATIPSSVSAVMIDFSATWTPGHGGGSRTMMKSMIVTQKGIIGTN